MNFLSGADDDSGLGLQHLVFFGISGAVILLLLLNESSTCDNTFKFCSLIIFSIVILYSLSWIVIMSLILFKVRGTERSFGGKNNVEFQFLQEPTVAKMLLVPIGLAGVFIISFYSADYNLPLVGIIGSGLVMSSVFVITKSVIPSIIIHGVYNSIVVYLRATQSSLAIASASSSPIQVPEVGITFFNQELISEILTQVFIVAVAEELFRVFIMFLLMIIINAKWDPNRLLPKILSMGGAVGLWAVYHLQLALN